MKKFVAFSLAVLLVAAAFLGLTGCGGKTTEIMMKNKDGDLYVWGIADIDIFSLGAGSYNTVITQVDEDGIKTKLAATIYVCEIDNEGTVSKDYKIFFHMYNQTLERILHYNEELGCW